MMADAQTLLALADRCEREEPSDALDEAIGLAVGWTRNEYDKDYWSNPNGRSDKLWTLPHFTDFIDAAIRLVPDGYAWTVENFWGNAARVIGPEDAEGNVPEGYSDTSGVKTPALALCAAALRARAALAKDQA